MLHTSRTLVFRRSVRPVLRPQKRKSVEKE
jgi:hypothetical protein